LQSNLTQKEYPLDYNLTAKDITQSSGIVDNIRITDYDQNIRTLNQIQNIRNYYTFKNSDISTYTINGVKTACYVSAREINTSNLQNNGQNYTNLRFKYTHGLGVVMNPVSKITSEGQPATVIKDIPTRSIDGAPVITEPRIYYGENTTEYVIVGTKSGEVDDITGDGYKYSGLSGIDLSFWNRLLFSFRKADFNMLISGEINSGSRLLINRQVVERVKKALPFLKIDADPSLVVADNGKLYWSIDAYTTTSAYPYAEYTNHYNYIRNSVKIIVDAYNGTVSAYVIDSTDPIIQSYAKMYPNVFSQEPLPSEIVNHIRYPEELFTVQSNILAKYHVADALSFYQRDDLWAIANKKGTDGKPTAVKPYYSLVQLENDVELVAMVPYTLSGKENLSGWLAVRCEQVNYGKMVLYTFPQGQNVYGTFQIENKIETDPAISRDLTLWGQGGSNVVRGNIIVVPIKHSLLYVEPVYITAGEKGISEVKGVVVSYNDQVVMGDNLDAALSELFGTKHTDEEQENTGLKSAIARISQLYRDYEKANGAADWAAAGTILAEIKKMITTLESYGGEL
jgi:uncharacterized membrane protein (UPF0182 family)